jgi:hypothetical protein
MNEEVEKDQEIVRNKKKSRKNNRSNKQNKEVSTTE